METKLGSTTHSAESNQRRETYRAWFSRYHSGHHSFNYHKDYLIWVYYHIRTTCIYVLPLITNFLELSTLKYLHYLTEPPHQYSHSQHPLKANRHQIDRVARDELSPRRNNIDLRTPYQHRLTLTNQD